ncbi:MAG: PAS domain S-box protein [Bdellovibrionota bacterium]
MTQVSPESSVLDQRTAEYFHARWTALCRRTDSFFASLMLAQWFGAVLTALILTPRAWNGTDSVIHPHIWAAIFLGGAIASLPIYLARKHPGREATRLVISVAQMLTSGLLVHLSGGRIETHFHIFGSLALLGFYRDWKVLSLAALVTALDHFLRGYFFPLSVYGVAYASPLRSVEHAAWVAFETTFLLWACRVHNEDAHDVAEKQAQLELMYEQVELTVKARSDELVRIQASINERDAQMETMGAILQTAADAIIVLDHTESITQVNAKAEKLFGYTTQELVGSKLSRLLSDGSRAKMTQIFVDSEFGISGLAETDYHEVEGKKKSGEAVAIELALSAIEIGSDRMFTIIVRDITQRQHMEVKLRQAQKLESVGQLAAGIAHEINTPIQFVSDNTRFLQEEFTGIRVLLKRCEELSQADDDHKNEAVASVVGAATLLDIEYVADEIPKSIKQSLEGIARVAQIVRAMKEFSHPGTSEKQSVDINRAIESTVLVSTNEWKYVADLETNFDRTLPLVACFPGEFNQVMLNLIVNAAHAIADRKDRHSHEKGLIRVSTLDCGPVVEIRVSDNGGGIPPEIAHKVFDPFFTTKEVGRGTGQGLALARSVICNKHGGTITFETTPGIGTTFVITMPLRDAVRPSCDAHERFAETRH